MYIYIYTYTEDEVDRYLNGCTMMCGGICSKIQDAQRIIAKTKNTCFIWAGYHGGLMRDARYKAVFILRLLHRTSPSSLWSGCCICLPRCHCCVLLLVKQVSEMVMMIIILIIIMIVIIMITIITVIVIAMIEFADFFHLLWPSWRTICFSLWYYGWLV